MDILLFVVEVVKYALAGSIVVVIANLLFWSKYNHHVSRWKVMELKRNERKELMLLRFQAYERIMLFVERINPMDLLRRLDEVGLDARQFQVRAIEEIRAEFQHNVTQQLYVSDRAWFTMVQVKEQTIALIRSAGSNLSTTASAAEFRKVVLAHLGSLDDDPYALALKAIKNELVD